MFCEGHSLCDFGELEPLAFKDGISLEASGHLSTGSTPLGKEKKPAIQGREQQTHERKQDLSSDRHESKQK